MSDILAPNTNASIGFEQSVAQVSPLEGLADLAGAFSRAKLTATKPSAADVKGASLRPFAQRLEELRNSSLTDQEFLREARKLGRNASVAYPQYQTDINTSLESYGVTTPADIVSPRDMQMEAITKWGQETVAGQQALITSTVIDSSGQVDMDATLENLGVSYQEDVAQRAQIEQSSRELQVFQDDEKKWKTQSRTKVQTFLPQWTKTSNSVTNSLVQLSSSGDPDFDSLDEQLAFLRVQRETLYNRFVADAQSAGLHSSAYSGEGSSVLTEALKPIDNMIATAENMAGDIELAHNAFVNLSKQNLLEQGVEQLSPWIVFSEFQRSIFSLMASDVYSEERVGKFLEGLDGQAKVGGISISQGRLSVEDARPAAVVQSEDGTVSTTSIIESTADVITEANPVKLGHETAAPTVTHQYKMLRVANSLLGPSALNRVFNPQAVSNVKEIIGKGDELSQQTRNEYLTFSAEQLKMNMAKVEDLLLVLPNYELGYDGSSVRVVEEGTSIPLSDRVGGKSSELLKAVNNINTINAASVEILGLEKEKTSTVLPVDSTVDIEDIKKYLEGTQEVTGGEGDPRVEGAASSDTLSPYGGDAMSLLRDFEGFRETPYWDVNAYRVGYGSDTITKADGSIVAVTQGMSVSREDAERDLARRTQEFNVKAREKIGGESWDTLPGNVTDALVSIAYNYGNIPDRIVSAVRSGDVESIAVAVEGLAGDNDGVNRSRRMREAAVIRGEALPPRGTAPIYTQRPQLPGENTGERDTTVTASLRPVARPESLSGELEQASGGEGTQRAPKVAPEAAKKAVSAVSEEQKAFLLRLFGTEDLLLRAIEDGVINLEDIKDV